MDACSTGPVMGQTRTAENDSMASRNSPFTWVDWLLLLATAGLSVHLAATLLDRRGSTPGEIVLDRECRYRSSTLWSNVTAAKSQRVYQLPPLLAARL